jgi:hypothetical protein
VSFEMGLIKVDSGMGLPMLHEMAIFSLTLPRTLPFPIDINNILWRMKSASGREENYSKLNIPGGYIRLFPDFTCHAVSCSANKEL